MKNRQRVRLNSLGIMRDWNPTQGLKNQSPKEVLKNLKKEVDKRISPKVCPKCKGNHDEKACTKLLLKEIEKKTPPPKDSRGVPKADRKDLEPKWDFQKGESVIDKDTEQWVEEQNKFWEEGKEGKEKNKKKVYSESLSLKLL